MAPKPVPIGNWLDRAIGVFAPERAEKRIRARGRIHSMATARNLYDAASISRRTQGWRSASTDANSENRMAIGRLRDAARDMVRNNAHAARAKSVIAHNVVGAGIIPRISGARPKRADQIKALIVDHFDTTDIDADGLLNLYGIQELVTKTVVESGECLIRKRIRRPSDGYALPFQLQVLEPDFIDTSKEGSLANGNFAIQGVEFDLRGKRVAYYLFDQHPGSLYASGRAMPQSKRVSADFVAHVFRVDRPGQVRGVTWFAPVMMRMRDLADYADAQLVRQKIAACFAAFITQENTEPLPDEGTAASGYPIESFEPGMIERMRPGDKIEFATPPLTQDFGPYNSATLHEVAAGLDIPYEALTVNLGEVSFISGRLGRIEFRSSVEAWRWNMLAPQMFEPLSRWTQEGAGVVTGSSEPFKLAWTPPRWEMLNPKEEIAAARDAIRSGLSWQSEEQRSTGNDPDEVRAGMLADFAWLKANGIVLDTDPRFVSSQGVAQPIVGAAAGPTK